MLSIQEIAKMLIDYRIENKLTQKELAEKLKISNSTLCKVEKQNPKVRRITLEKIIKKFNDF